MPSVYCDHGPLAEPADAADLKASLTDFLCSDVQLEPDDNAGLPAVGDAQSGTDEPAETVVRTVRAAPDAVESALATAIDRASAAGAWDAVTALVGELRARREHAHASTNDGAALAERHR